MFSLFKTSGKHKTQSAMKDRTLVERNAKAAEALRAYTDDAQTDEKIVELCEKLKYLVPKESDEVYKLDCKISDALDDLKLALSKGVSPARAGEAIKAVLILTEERNVRL